MKHNSTLRPRWVNRTVLGIALTKCVHHALKPEDVGMLWSVVGAAVAFGYIAALFIVGAGLALRLTALVIRHSLGVRQSCFVISLRDRSTSHGMTRIVL